MRRIHRQIYCKDCGDAIGGRLHSYCLLCRPIKTERDFAKYTQLIERINALDELCAPIIRDLRTAQMLRNGSATTKGNNGNRDIRGSDN